MDDHQQYAKSYDECVGWLTSTHDRLAMLSNTTTDRETIQKQLENIHVSDYCIFLNLLDDVVKSSYLIYMYRQDVKCVVHVFRSL